VQGQVVVLRLGVIERGHRPDPRFEHRLPVSLEQSMWSKPAFNFTRGPGPKGPGP